MKTFLLVTLCLTLMAQGLAEPAKTDPKSPEAGQQEHLATQLPQEKPLTDKAFAAWSPRALLGLPATNIRSTVNDELSTFTLTYYGNAKKIVLNLVDGASPKGAQLIAPAQRIETSSVDDSSEEGYTKTVHKDGITALEKYQKASDSFKIDFLYDGRYYVVLETVNLDRDKIWEAIAALDFESL